MVAKQRKPKSKSKNESDIDYLTALNDDCIFAIFKYINLDDLCAVRRTCTKMYRLAGQHYQRKHSDAFLTLTETDNNIKVKKNSKHSKCFSRYIRNLDIISSKKRSSEIPIYLQSNFKHNKLIGIRFDGFFNTTFGNQISNILENVENLTLDYGENKAYCDNILKHCKRLKQLEIENVNFTKVRKFPSLKRFVFRCHGNYFGQTSFNKLREFLHLNPSIKQFKWLITGDDLTKHINSFVDCAKNLEVISFHIEGGFDAADLYDSLSSLDEQQNIQQMELTVIKGPNESKYSIANFNKLSKLTKLTGINFQYGLDTRMLAELDVFANVKTFYMDCSNAIEFDSTNLAKSLPNLKTLQYVRQFDDAHDYRIQLTLAPFARYSTKLEKIVALDHWIFDGGNIPMLDQKRAQLKDACELTIYMKDHIYNANKRFINTLNKKSKLVKIMKTSFKMQFFPNILEFDNGYQ